MKSSQIQDMPNNTCLNCNELLEEAYQFCPFCGQETSDKIITFKQFIQDFLGDYFTFDSKIFRSLIPLLFKPGFLTNEYLGGRRVKYILPLRLYIFISIIFFLLFSIDSANERNAQPYLDNMSSEFSPAFYDEFFNKFVPKLFFILLPLFAFLLKLLFKNKKKFYLGHFIFSLHFHSFVFILFSIYLILSTIEWNENIFAGILSLFLLLTGIYLFVGLKNVYHDTLLRISVKFILLLSTYILFLMFFSLISSYFFYQLYF